MPHCFGGICKFFNQKPSAMNFKRRFLIVKSMLYKQLFDIDYLNSKLCMLRAGRKSMGLTTVGPIVQAQCRE